MKQYVIFIALISLCIAQQPPARQVTIGGELADQMHTAQTYPRPALRNSTPGYITLLKNSLTSPSEPLCTDIGICCGTCPVGLCMTCATFPQVGLLYHCTANCLLSGCVLYFSLSDYPEEFSSGKLIAKLKKDIYSALGLQNTKEKHD